MYKGPIEFIDSAADSFTLAIKKAENDLVYQAVCKKGVEVDKEELLKALKYDRGQYEKGYRDALEDRIKMCSFEVDYKTEILAKDDLNKIKAEARAEAIKEFAERVIKYVYESDDINHITDWGIYEIAKEMGVR